MCGVADDDLADESAGILPIRKATGTPSNKTINYAPHTLATISARKLVMRARLCHIAAASSTAANAAATSN